MAKKPGRNDPCWCGSGRKLKKCHGFIDRRAQSDPPLQVPPARVPTSITTHEEWDGEKWVSRPGLLAARIHVVPANTADPELDTLRKKWGEALPPSSPSGPSLAARLNDIAHKLRGVRYHRDNYERHEDTLIAKFSRNHVPPSGAAVVQEEPRLTFEIEGFLYQVKSALDMLAQFLRDLGFQSVGETFGDKGDGVIKGLRSLPKECAEEATAIETLIRTAQGTWLDEAVATRDRIAHRGMLEDLTCFIQEPYVGGPQATLHYPTMPNGERARNYLARVEQELRVFVDAFVGLALAASSKRDTSKHRES